MKPGAILLATMAAAGLGWAARAAELEPVSPVPGHPGVTYADLVRQAVPDLKLDPSDHQFEGHASAPFRHVAGKVYQAEPPDPLVLGFIQARTIRVGGKPRLVVLADLGQDPESVQSTALVLLFDDAPKPRLLDVADVATDRDTVLSDDVGKVALGPGDEAIVTYSEHNDADLTMGAYLVVSPIGDRLRLISLADVTSVKLCGWTQIQSVAVTTAPDPAAPYRRVTLTVRSKGSRTGEDCDPPPPKPQIRVFRAVYRWDAARHAYVTVSSTLKALDAMNEKGF